MTLEKAIEILGREIHDITLSPGLDVPDALKLGIEALKRIKYRRDQGKGYEPRPLPGETEE